MAMFFRKTKNVQTLIFTFENFNNKIPFFFELQAVELAISFCWVLKIFESYHKNITFPQSWKFMCLLTVQPFQYLAKLV